MLGNNMRKCITKLSAELHWNSDIVLWNILFEAKNC